MTAPLPGHPAWRFALVGAGNTAAGLVLIFGARAAGLGEVTANACGYALGLVLSFTLNRHWTFRHRGPLHSSALKFIAVMLLAWLANLGTLLALLRGGVTGAPAQVLSVLPYALVGYLGCRLWAFRSAESRRNAFRPMQTPAR